jgi:3-hydroxyisobutyrate dehydrogenase-like beta-hydroxyacid dehydrogenase
MKIGIIGVGTMGFPISERMLNHGVELSFYARRKDVIKDLQEKGAVYTSIKEIGSSCDAVILFVNTFEQCVECTTELLSSMKKGILSVCATISPDEMEILSQMCQRAGVTAVASPVTGGVKGAKEGTLTLIMSGPKEEIDTLKPIYSTFGNNIVFCGESIRAAHTMKLLVQLLVGINTVTMSEVFTLGVKNGLPPQLIYNTICKSAGTTRIFENRGQSVIDRNFSKRGTVDILCKDLKYCVDMGAKSDSPIPIGQFCANLFLMAEHMLEDTTQDFSAIVQVYEKWAGMQVGE